MNEYYFAAFATRSHTMRFYNAIGRYGVAARVINTPQEVREICGVCVAFAPSDLDKVVNFLRSNGGYFPKGIFLCKNQGWRRIITRIR